MRSRTSFFNGAVYRSCLRRFWPVWAGLLLVWLLVMVLPILGGAYGRGQEFYEQDLQQVGVYGGIIIAAVFSLLAAMTVYAFLYQQKSVGFSAALPVKREAMFLSSYLAGLTMLLLPALATAVFALLAALLRGWFIPLTLLSWLGVYLLQVLCFYGLASLCALFTGSLWVLPLVYSIFNFLSVAVWGLVCLLLEYLVYGFSGGGDRIAAIFSPSVQMMAYSARGGSFNGWPGMLAYGFAGLVMALGALLLYRRRAMETATDVVAVPVLKPVFRWCLGVGSALALGNLLYILVSPGDYKTAAMTCFVLIGGLLGWYVGEMLIRKSYKVFAGWLNTGIFAALLAAGCILCGSGCFGFESRVPDTGRVESVTYQLGGYTQTARTPEDIDVIRSLHRTLAGRKRAQSGGRTEYADPQLWRRMLHLTYTLDDGRVMKRRYWAEFDTSEPLLAELDAVMERCALRELESLPADSVWYIYVHRYAQTYETKKDSIELEQTEARRLFTEGILPDSRVGATDIVDILDSGGDGDIYVNLDVRVAREQPGRYTYNSYTLRLTPAALRSLAILRELGFETD